MGAPGTFPGATYLVSRGREGSAAELHDDVNYVERQILKALPKLAKAAQCARGKTCEAINGSPEEGEEVVEDFLQGVVRDADIMARSRGALRDGALRHHGGAKTSGFDEVVAKLMLETLQE